LGELRVTHLDIDDGFSWKYLVSTVQTVKPGPADFDANPVVVPNV
jgi:hypothetical protein